MQSLSSTFNGFTEDFGETFDAQDWSLAIGSTVTNIDPRILEVYTRFWHLGWLDNYGNQCFLISEVLRRILRIHGIETHLQEVIFDFTHPKKQWYQRVGSPMEITHGGVVDTHRVVTTPDLILDWAHRDSIYRPCGAMSPRGFIVDKSLYKEEQDLGFFGRGKWTARKMHQGSKNISLLQRDQVKHLITEYFHIYKI